MFVFPSKNCEKEKGLLGFVCTLQNQKMDLDSGKPILKRLLQSLGTPKTDIAIGIARIIVQIGRKDTGIGAIIPLSAATKPVDQNSERPFPRRLVLVLRNC